MILSTLIVDPIAPPPTRAIASAGAAVPTPSTAVTPGVSMAQAALSLFRKLASAKTKPERDALDGEIQEFCSVPANVPNCKKIGAYFSERAKEAEGKIGLSGIYTALTANLVEYNTTKVKFETLASDAGLTGYKYYVFGQPAACSTPDSKIHNSLGSPALGPEFSGREKEISALIEGFAPRCKNAGTEVFAVAVGVRSNKELDIWTISGKTLSQVSPLAEPALE